MTKIDFKLNGKSVKQTSIQYKQHLTKFKEIVNTPQKHPQGGQWIYFKRLPTIDWFQLNCSDNVNCKKYRNVHKYKYTVFIRTYYPTKSEY